jgi:hypothetical protein
MTKFWQVMGLGLLVVGQVGWIPWSLRAELPPKAYDSLQAKAEEVLTIEVSKVQTTQLSSTKTAVTLTAKVLRKKRSKAKLAIGTPITIFYETNTANMPGPRPLKVLQQGQVYRAFLNRSKDGKAFLPAAYGLSFILSPS